jgi:hypothetical protein
MNQNEKETPGDNGDLLAIVVINVAARIRSTWSQCQTSLDGNVQAGCFVTLKGILGGGGDCILAR